MDNKESLLTAFIRGFVKGFGEAGGIVFFALMVALWLVWVGVVK